jgi:hypothetical protein
LAARDSHKNKSLLFVPGVLLIAVGPRADAVSVPLPRSTPEAQGVSSQAILAFVKATDKNIKTMHSHMIVRHDQVIAEGWWKPEAPDKPHILNAVGKSFDGGEFTQPAFSIGDDGFHLRLLEHDLGNPDGVGIARAPPR